jgi:thiamine biosynthesis lipoprotein
MPELAARPPRPGYWVERRLRAMGSDAHLVVGDTDDALVDWAVAELARLEQCWTRFRPDSELQRLNARAGRWTTVSPPMLAALTRAREAWFATGGAFDPTVLDALEAAGYDRSFERIVDGDTRPPSPAPGFGTVELDAGASAVRAAPGTHIDLGGIGKGLAADLVAQGLVERGARSALVGIGGDLRACGDAPEPDGWPVPVAHPHHEREVAFVHPLRAGGLVTSTTLVRRWSRGGQAMHHLIDPRTGTPARTSVVAVVAVAPTAWFAETVAKAIVVAGVDHANGLARRTGVRAWCFFDDGTVLTAG